MLRRWLLVFCALLSAIPSSAFADAYFYTVRQGDIASEILRVLRMVPLYGRDGTLVRLTSENPEIPDIDKVIAGQRINLPRELVENSQRAGKVFVSEDGEVFATNEVRNDLPQLTQAAVKNDVGDVENSVRKVANETPVSETRATVEQSPAVIVTVREEAPPVVVKPAPVAPAAQAQPAPTPSLKAVEPIPAPAQVAAPSVAVVPVVKPAPVVEEDPVDHSIALSAEYRMTEFHAVDKVSDTVAQILTARDIFVSAAWRQAWDESFTTYQSFGLRNVTFEPSAPGSKTIGTGEKSISHFEFGLTQKITDRVSVGYSFGYGTELFVRGLNSTTVVVDAVPIPSAGLEASLDLLRRGGTSLGVLAQGRYLFHGRGDMISIEPGFHYAGAVSIKKKSPSMSLRLDLGYEMKSQETSITRQDESAAYGILQLEFPIFESERDSERSHVSH